MLIFVKVINTTTCPALQNKQNLKAFFFQSKRLILSKTFLENRVAKHRIYHDAEDIFPHRSTTMLLKHDDFPTE